MTRAGQANLAKARRMRAQAGRLCGQSDRLQKQCDGLFEQIDALSVERGWVLEQIDDLYERANALHPTQVVRRQCLKCDRSFGSTGFSNRLCNTCNAANSGLRDLPTSPPKMNGIPMRPAREER